MSRSQYTSKFSSLTIPCSISSGVSWEQIKAVGIQGGHWDFFPKPDSGLISPDPQRLFSLSLEDPVGWKAEQGTGLIPISDFKKGDLSLKRDQGREEDKGRYVCSLEFKNGVTLNRTVDVHVLQSKSKHTALSQPSSFTALTFEFYLLVLHLLHCPHLSFWCPASLLPPQLSFITSCRRSFLLHVSVSAPMHCAIVFISLRQSLFGRVPGLTCV